MGPLGAISSSIRSLDLGGAPAGDPAGAPATGAGSFAATLSSALSELNGTVVSADAKAADFAAGKGDITDVLLAMQDSSIGLRLGTAVRDRLLESYSEIMRLQV